ncbi:MAG: hypothetical protein JXB39_00150 [Deltaproteobacteria bacterium]|nr:hypothetical protein [Deltaproteobacteria bacterium]
MQRLLVLLLAFLPACGGSDDTASGSEDADHDGIPASEDCDDHDPDVGGPSTWYRDADQDAFGDPDRTEEACEPEDGWVDNGIDCDDQDPSLPILVDGTRGSDAHTGGADDPLATVGAALATGAGCIAIRPGTYVGSYGIDRTVLIGATSGPDDTVLDAAGAGPVFDVQGGAPAIWFLTLTGGTGTLVDSDLLGGAVSAWHAEGLDLVGSVLRGNTAEYGGAVFGPMKGVLTARDCLFTGNSASFSAGAVYAVAADVQGSRFEDNSARYGGGAFFTGGIVAAEGAVFRDNRAVASGDSGGKGGGAWVDASARLTGGTFEDNSATSDGGGLYTRTTAVVRDVTVTGNEAENGGGIASEGGLDLTGATVTGNTASDYGGGIYADGDLDVTDTRIADNLAQMGGGMLLQETRGTFRRVEVASNTGGVNGGGLYLHRCTLELADTLVTGNQAPYGAGVDLDGGAITATGTQVSDNVARDFGGGIYLYAVATWTGGTLSGNRAPQGAGIYADAHGSTVTGATLNGNVASSLGGGVFVDEDVTLDGVVLEANRADLMGAAVSVAGGHVVLSGCTLHQNEAVQRGGGAHLSTGSLRSEASDWGEGGEDNVPDDVWDGANPYEDFGADETFTCTARKGCT